MAPSVFADQLASIQAPSESSHMEWATAKRLLAAHNMPEPKDAVEAIAIMAQLFEKIPYGASSTKEPVFARSVLLRNLMKNGQKVERKAVTHLLSGGQSVETLTREAEEYWAAEALSFPERSQSTACLLALIDAVRRKFPLDCSCVRKLSRDARAQVLRVYFCEATYQHFKGMAYLSLGFPCTKQHSVAEPVLAAQSNGVDHPASPAHEAPATLVDQVLPAGADAALNAASTVVPLALEMGLTAAKPRPSAGAPKPPRRYNVSIPFVFCSPGPKSAPQNSGSTDVETHNPSGLNAAKPSASGGKRSGPSNGSQATGSAPGAPAAGSKVFWYENLTRKCEVHCPYGDMRLVDVPDCPLNAHAAKKLDDAAAKLKDAECSRLEAAAAATLEEQGLIPANRLVNADSAKKLDNEAAKLKDAECSRLEAAAAATLEEQGLIPANRLVLRCRFVPACSA